MASKHVDANVTLKIRGLEMEDLSESEIRERLFELIGKKLDGIATVDDMEVEVY